MAPARRDFIKELLASGALSGLFASPAAAKTAAKLLAGNTGAGQEPEQEFDTRSRDFWTSFADATDDSARPGVHQRGKPSHGGSDLGRSPVFLQFNKKQGFRAVSDIKAEELLQHNGDVTVGLNVTGFKASEPDKKLFERLQSAQLRLDMMQNKPILKTLDPMAWTAIAALFPTKSGKMPPLANLSFDPGATWQKMQSVLLPGGTGRWAVNFSIQEKASMFSQIMKLLITEFGRFAPVLGMPAISVGALSAFTAFYAYVHPPNTTPLFETLPVNVYATAPTWKDLEESEGLPLAAGDYVLVPRNQLNDIKSKLPDLELQQGYIVPKGTTGLDIYNAALDTNKVPDVTYVTVSAKVRPTQLVGEEKET